MEQIDISTVRQMQANFLDNPRANIIELLSRNQEATDALIHEGVARQSTANQIIFYTTFKEFSSLIRTMWQAGNISPSIMKNDLEDITIYQRIREQQEVIKEYEQIRDNRQNLTSVNSQRLGRGYADLLEIIWRKLKRLVCLAGLNPQNRHLSIPQLKRKVEEIERQYNISLNLLKLILDSELRNSVQHANTAFEAPDKLKFYTLNGQELQEIAELSVEEVYEKIKKLSMILWAMGITINQMLISALEPLLKLTDEQLTEFAQTGIYTDSMIERIIS